MNALFEDTLESLTLPDVYLRLRELMASETASLADAADVLSLDPALAARVLRIANSAYYGFASQVDTITRAVNILGMQVVHDLALAAGISKATEGLHNPVMDLNTFWYRSLHCALLAKEMAVAAGIANTESVFVRGLLHDIGHLLLFCHYPEESRQALSQADGGLEKRLQAEQEAIGIDAYQLGAELARAWQLPESFATTFTHLVHPEAAPEPEARDIAVLQIAAQISDGIDFDLLIEQILEQASPATWALAGLSSDAAVAAVDASSLEMVDAMYRTPSPQEEAA